MTLQELTAHYSAVRKRIALPPKPPIVIRLSDERVLQPIKHVGAVARKETRGKLNNREIQDLLKEGRTIIEIADHFSASHSYMRRYIKERNFNVPPTARLTRLGKSAEAIKAMWMSGMSGGAISRELGFEQSTINKFLRKQDWTR